MKTRPSRIDQFVASFMPRDAISTECDLMRHMINERGYGSEIFSEQWHQVFDKYCNHLFNYGALADNEKNIVISHYSIGSSMPYFLKGIRAFKIIRNHNITPPKFFAWDKQLGQYFESTKYGLAQSEMVFNGADLVWSDSLYNAESFNVPESRSIVLPVIRDYARISTLKDVDDLARRLNDGRKNILFVGRMTPNKAQHDLLFLLKHIHTHIDSSVRLIMVGCQALPTYAPMVFDLAQKLGFSVDKEIGSPHADKVDVLAPGSIDERDMATYYRHADAFVCLSEHEGFCVPLVEAMFFGLPIVAHASSAVPETLGSGGLIIDKNDPVTTLAAMKAVLGDKGFAAQLRQKSCERAKDFSWVTLGKLFSNALAQSIDFFEKTE